MQAANRTSSLSCLHRVANTSLAGHVIGLALEDRRCMPDVIAIASEPTKITGLFGALRTGVVNTLAITQSFAQTVLGLAQATEAS